MNVNIFNFCLLIGWLLVSGGGLILNFGGGLILAGVLLLALSFFSVRMAGGIYSADKTA